MSQDLAVLAAGATFARSGRLVVIAVAAMLASSCASETDVVCEGSPACEPILECDSSEDCPPGLACWYNLDGEPRGCVAPAKEGGECITDELCAGALVCEGVAPPGYVGWCVPLGEEGEPCAAGRCVEGLECYHSQNVCYAVVGEGESCEVDGLRNPGPCGREGLFCTNELTCQPAGAEGEPCASGIADSCQEDLFCSPTAGLCSTQGAPEGEPCDPAWSNSCEQGLECSCPTPADCSYRVADLWESEVERARFTEAGSKWPYVCATPEP